MGLGTNRDYKSRDIKATATLNIHKQIMNMLMDKFGLDKKTASNMAYDEIIKGFWNKEIKEEEKRIRDKRNRR